MPKPIGYDEQIARLAEAKSMVRDIEQSIIDMNKQWVLSQLSTEMQKWCEHVLDPQGFIADWDGEVRIEYKQKDVDETITVLTACRDGMVETENLHSREAVDAYLLMVKTEHEARQHADDNLIPNKDA